MQLIIIAFFILFHSIVSAANFSLEIIQPRSGLSTTNRFYKAYPGLEYNVRMAVIGGAYPFTYQLTTCPSGMTINSSTGEISWPDPTTTGSPHAVTASVTDSESSQQTVSWTVTVTTSGFYFIDAVNGQTVANGGTGSISAPWKILDDWYISKNDTSYQNAFIYFKSGIYTPPALEDGDRLAFVGTNKPKVWLAYPGESPVFNMSSAYICVYAGGGNNFYVDGIDFSSITNPERKGIQVDGSSTNVVIRNSKFHGTTALASTNMAHIFIATDSSGQYWAIQDNLFYDSVRTMGIEGYDASKVLIEDNSLYNISSGGGESHGIAPKSRITRWEIRHNSLWEIDDHSIWLGGSNSNDFSDNEIRFNVIKNVGSGYALTTNYDGTSLFGDHYIYRNTFVGPILIRNATSSRGTYYLADNVIQGTGISYETPATPESGAVSLSGNLTGASGIVDADGLLTASYQDYLGLVGWQIEGSPIGGRMSGGGTISSGGYMQ